MSEHSIKEQRISLGLSRKELADEAGVTIGAVASLEAGRGSRDKDATAKIVAALKARIIPQTRAENDKATPRAFRNVAAIPSQRAGWEYLDEWNGMRPESRFTVVGEEGVFSFLRFVKTCNGKEWVDGIGGERGYPAAFRSFRPERVRPFA